jgi:hypothetical protein
MMFVRRGAEGALDDGEVVLTEVQGFEDGSGANVGSTRLLSARVLTRTMRFAMVAVVKVKIWTCPIELP